MPLQKKILIPALLIALASTGTLVYKLTHVKDGAVKVKGAVPVALQGMPPVKDRSNLYSETGPLALSHAVRGSFRASTCPICAATTCT